MFKSDFKSLVSTDSIPGNVLISEITLGVISGMFLRTGGCSKRESCDKVKLSGSYATLVVTAITLKT